jgi:hypothetical protein
LSIVLVRKYHRDNNELVEAAVLRYKDQEAAAGKGFDDVLRAGVYLTSMSDDVAVNGTTPSISVNPFPSARDRGGGAAAWACVEIDLLVKA